MRHYLRECSLLLAFVILLVIVRVLAPDFFAADNIRNLLVKNTPILVAAIGMTLVIVARHIDISIGSQFSVCGIVAGLLSGIGLPMPLVAAGSILTGATMGAFNGGLIAMLGLPSIVVTLATLVIWRESLRW